MAAWKRLLAIVIAGLALGAATQVLHGILPGPFAMLANGLSPWLIAAFVTGVVMPTSRWAVGAGPLLLIAALAGSYLAVQLRPGDGWSKGSLIVWTAVTVVGGPVFGGAGWGWRRADRWWIRGLAAGLLGGLLLMEAFYLPGVAGFDDVAPFEAVVALLVPIMLGWTWRERLLGVVSAIPWAIAGTLALVLAGLVQMGVSGVQ